MAPAPTVDVVVGQPSNTFKDVKDAKSSSKSPSSTATTSKESSPRPPATSSSVSAVASTASSTLTKANQDPVPVVVKNGSPGKNVNVDNFVPDANDIDNFLDEEPSPRNMSKLSIEDPESDEDESAAGKQIKTVMISRFFSQYLFIFRK